MREVSYGDFSADLHRRIADTRIPVNASIEVTRRCPLDCVHCYTNLPLGDRAARRRELGTDELCRLLDDLADAGCLWLLFTGGEIFARRDFLDVYTHARRAGFLVTLFTNGTLITPRIADLLAERRPFAVEITLYGSTRETYERVTRRPGSFDRCLRGIRLVVDRDLPLKLKTMALTVNRHELEGMKAFAERLGVELVFDAAVNPRIDCSQSPLAVRLTPEEVVELDLRDSRRAAAWRDLAERFRGPFPQPAGPAPIYDCGGGFHSLAVDPEGRMSVCVLAPRRTAGLRGSSFHDGWAFLSALREQPATRTTRCTTCPIKVMCGMCPANGELECGDAETPVDFLCQVAHLRAATLGIPVGSHGDCPYCPGGRGHAHVVDTTARLRATAAESAPAPRAVAVSSFADPEVDSRDARKEGAMP